jgi:tripartite-type tricarboxylate transporter receptor subunit TctC
MNGGDFSFIATRPIALGMLVLFAAFPHRGKPAREGRLTLKRRNLLVVGAAVLASSRVAPARADAWPRRPLTILVPFDVGGSADRLARGLAQFMPKYLDQPMTVVDRAGAGGLIATTWFMQPPPDGYPR